MSPELHAALVAHLDTLDPQSLIYRAGFLLGVLARAVPDDETVIALLAEFKEP